MVYHNYGRTFRWERVLCHNSDNSVMNWNLLKQRVQDMRGQAETDNCDSSVIREIKRVIVVGKVSSLMPCFQLTQFWSRLKLRYDMS
jgi:hypothetical protein